MTSAGTRSDETAILRALSVRPLSTTPRTAAGVPIFGYVTGRGIDWQQPASRRDFDAIDVDAWARYLFAAIDDVLSPALAEPAAILGRKDGLDYLAPVVDAKRRLAEATRSLLTPVFAEGADSVSDSGRQQAAQADFERSLLIELSRAYDNQPGRLAVLREVPVTPTMVEQTARRTEADTAAASEPPVAAWDFAFTYSRETHPTQDTIHGKVRFNRCDVPRDAKLQRSGEGRRGAATAADAGSAAGATTEAAGSSPDARRDRLTDLAEFVTVYPDVAKDLGAWLAPLTEATTDETALTNARVALQSFAALAGRAADSWSSFAEPAPDASAMRAGPDAYAFAIRERAIEIDGARVWLVTIQGGAPPGGGDPRVEIEGYTATPHPVPGGYGYIYAKSGVPAGTEWLDPARARGIASRTLVLPRLHAGEHKDACASLQVVRNESLLDDPAVRTAEAFIYRTEWVRFPQAVDRPAY